MGSIDNPISKTKIIDQKLVINDEPPSDKDKSNNDSPSNLPGIIFFILITTIFTLVTYLIMPNTISNDYNQSNLLYLTIYILLLVIGN